MKRIKRTTKPFILPSIILLSAWTLQATPEEEFRAQQTAYTNLSYKTEDSFWDPSIWRNLTNPVGGSLIPGETDYLYFGVKNTSGSSISVPTENYTLYTAAHSGFIPPAFTPNFYEVDFDGDEVIFNGVPDVIGAPFGRFALFPAQPLTLRLESKVEFDHTILHADSVNISPLSTLTISGDVTPQGETYNFRSLGTLGIGHAGDNPRPSLRLRSGAIANLANLNLATYPATSPAASGASISIESGSHLQANSILLTNSAGKVFDASAGYARATLGQLSINGSTPETDSAVIFHATGSNLTNTNFTLAGNCFLNGFNGALAQIEDGAHLQIQGILSFLATESKIGLEANRGGQISLSNLKSSEPSSPGSAQIDWQATTNGEISIAQSMTSPLQINGEAHTLSALSGGKIDIPDQLGIDPDGRLLISVSGTNSELKTKFNTHFAPFDFINQPSAKWSHVNLSITNGGLLRGGLTEDFGGGNYYANLSNLIIQDTASRSDLSVTGASLKNIGISFQNSAVDCVVGSESNPSTLNQVSINVGDSSTFLMRNSTWQPERVEMINTTAQALQVGQDTGGSLGTITGNSLAHSLAINIGSGPFSTMIGAPTPVVTNSVMNVNGNSTVTGSLSVAQYTNGKGTVNISGEGTRCSFSNVQLGVASRPLLNTGPSGPLLPSNFQGKFFSIVGGESVLNLTSGARMAIGGHQGAFSQWIETSSNSPAYLSANNAPIFIDSTSAIFLGDAESALDQNFQNGALVLASGGFLVGTPIISGNVVNAGGVTSPGFSPGTLTVNGNFLMETGTLILEVESNNPGDFDKIIANSINITGGTIIIRRAQNYSSGTGINVDFLQTSSLNISPSVTIELEPELGSATWDPITGEIAIIAGSENDLNRNSMDDRLEAVLPLTGSQLAWPQFLPTNPPVLSFRRKKPSLFSHDVMVQWSEDMMQWNSITIPFSSQDDIQITEIDSETDLIEVTLPTPAGMNPRIFTRLAITKSSSPF